MADVFIFGSEEMKKYLDELAEKEPTKYYRLHKWNTKR